MTPFTGSMPLGPFLFSHLQDLGVRHCFGIPGDYILPLYKALEETPGIEAVVATHEPNAAFGADAYGRLTGLGVLLVTYGVGGFNAMNGVAGAYAESSPLLVISGGPQLGARDTEDLFAPTAHHFVKHTSSQMEAFRQVTDLALRLESPETAAASISRAVAHALRVKRPVYLEIPTDLMTADIPVVGIGRARQTAFSEALETALDFFLKRIQAAQNPVLMIGAEVGRYGLQPEIRKIKAARNMPVVTSVLGKGVLDETEPGVLGVYAGVISQTPQVRELVEGADLVIMAGVKVTDVNCGAFTADLERDRILVAKSEWVGDGHMRFSQKLPLDRFITLLAERLPPSDSAEAWPAWPVPNLADSTSLMDRYLSVINAHLDDTHVIVADTGDSCYGSLFMTVQRDNGYLAPTFYNTMGFAVPAALGAQLAEPTSRPIVLVGDGAFQMTGLEFSGYVAHGLNPIVVLFNNGGYGMQRIFVDGRFNDIGQWDYGRVIELVGGGKAWRVSSAEELEAALQEAMAFTQGPSLIEAIVPKGQISTGLSTLGAALQREKTGACPLNGGDGPCEHEGQCAFCRAAIWE